jgi:hypothetical protein
LGFLPALPAGSSVAWRDEMDAQDLLDTCEELIKRIETCDACGGSGHERHSTDDACGCCGGQGEVLDATPLVSDIRDAVAVAKVFDS